MRNNNLKTGGFWETCFPDKQCSSIYKNPDMGKLLHPDLSFFDRLFFDREDLAVSGSEDLKIRSSWGCEGILRFPKGSSGSNWTKEEMKSINFVALLFMKIMSFLFGLSHD